MSELCIQIHPLRDSQLDMTLVRSVAERVAANDGLVTRLTIIAGDDQGPYVNLTFGTTRPEELWRNLQEAFYKKETVGASLGKSSIVTCEGKDGWNDYRLLFHFDPTAELDLLDSE